MKRKRSHPITTTTDETFDPTPALEEPIHNISSTEFTQPSTRRTNLNEGLLDLNLPYDPLNPFIPSLEQHNTPIDERLTQNKQRRSMKMKTVCRYYRTKGTCWKGKACRFEHPGSKPRFAAVKQVGRRFPCSTMDCPLYARVENDYCCQCVVGLKLCERRPCPNQRKSGSTENSILCEKCENYEQQLEPKKKCDNAECSTSTYSFHPYCKSCLLIRKETKKLWCQGPNCDRLRMDESNSLCLKCFRDEEAIHPKLTCEKPFCSNRRFSFHPFCKACSELDRKRCRTPGCTRIPQERRHHYCRFCFRNQKGPLPVPRNTMNMAQCIFDQSRKKKKDD